MIARVVVGLWGMVSILVGASVPILEHSAGAVTESVICIGLGTVILYGAVKDQCESSNNG